MPIYRPSGPIVLLTGQSVGTGTTYTISSSVITAPFVALELMFSSIGHNDAGSQGFRIEMSGDNGGAWSAAQTITATVASSARLSGRGVIYNANASGTATRPFVFFLGSNAAGSNMSNYAGDLSQAGPINALRLSPAAGSFAAGTVTLIGWR